MDPSDDDERLLEPQEAVDAERQDQVEQLEHEEREEDDAEADFDEDVTPQDKAAHYAEIVGLANGIFKGDELDVEEAASLSADEHAALRVLAEAVRGVDLDDEGDLIYAEDRLSMLNQALAVLQPTLALGLAPELVELRDAYDQLVDEVTELRDTLERLGDAQEEMFAQDREAAKDEGGDTDDDDDDEENQAEKDRKAAEQRAAAHPTEAVPEPGQPARPSTLAGKPGEPAVVQPARPSAVAGQPGEPAVAPPARSSTLAGKPGEPAVVQPPRPSTAYDGDK